MALTTLQQVISYVGIDISKRKIDCWLRPLGEHLCTANDQQGFKQLHQWLIELGCKQDKTIICMENTGIYGKKLLLALHQNGWKCAVEKTTVLEKVSPEHHRKDDRFDARLLAEYADRFTDLLHVKKPAVPALDCLRQLLAERNRLTRQRRATKTKQTQANQEPHGLEVLQKGWQDQITFLDKQIATLEEQIEKIIKSHQDLNSYFELLTDIPGVGPVTGWLWLMMFYGQKTLNPKKIASRLGVAPHSSRSGSSVRGTTRSSGHGVASMRGTLSMAAQSAYIMKSLKSINNANVRKANPGRLFVIT